MVWSLFNLFGNAHFSISAKISIFWLEIFLHWMSLGIPSILAANRGPLKLLLLLPFSFLFSHKNVF